MSDDPARLVGNALELGRTGRYAAILGLTPSQGARSPHLWNAVFEAEGADLHFHPLDVAEDALAEVVAALKADTRFVGGSVTMPYKRDILPLLDRIEPEAETIGAVNALYRDADGALVGANTDGEGALVSLLAALDAPDLGARRVVLAGLGGAGRAVAVYMHRALGAEGSLVLVNRTGETAETLAGALGPKATAVPFPIGEDAAAGADILINCTALGFSTGQGVGPDEQLLLTPLGPDGDLAANLAGALKTVASLDAGATVFDIVYQPDETQLLRVARALGRRTLNGRAMNLEQAVLAFRRAVPEIGADRVREIMARVP